MISARAAGAKEPTALSARLATAPASAPGRPLVIALMLVLAGMIALALACGSRLPAPPFSAHRTAELVAVPFPPPPARVEVVPEPPPSDAAMWIDGEWTWRGRKWGWRAGYWTEGGAGLTYAPWQITRDDAGTLYFAPGAWHDAEGEVVASPPPARIGHARAESVVTPEGEIEATGVNVHPDGGRLRPQDGGA